MVRPVLEPSGRSRADIRPSSYLPLRWALRPPGQEAYQHSFDLGYRDAGAWIRATGALEFLAFGGR